MKIEIKIDDWMFGWRAQLMFINQVLKFKVPFKNRKTGIACTPTPAEPIALH